MPTIGTHPEGVETLVPARCWVDGRSLCWEWSSADGRGAGRGPGIARATPKLLDGFVDLEGATDAEIRSFAARRGVLTAFDSDVSTNVGAEPLSTWRLHAREAGAVRDIARSLRVGEPTMPEQWGRFASFRAELAERYESLVDLVHLRPRSDDVLPGECGDQYLRRYEEQTSAMVGLEVQACVGWGMRSRRS